MELTDLRYFLHAAIAGSFAEGAARSHISQPAMSKAIQRLEEGLGVKLFDRTARRVALTPAGQVLRARAERLLAEAHQMREDLAALSGEVRGELRIGAMEVFSSALLPDAVSALVSEHPDVEPRLYEMIPEVQSQALSEGLLDVGFTIGARPGPAVSVEVLGASPGVLVCGLGHPLHGVPRVEPTDLARFPSVVPRFFGKHHLPSLDQFPETELPRRVGATIELLQMAVRLVANGSYLGFFPRVSVQAELDERRLWELGMPLAEPPSFELQALTRRDAQEKRSVGLLLEEVRRRIV